jgi:hypothetical protein
MPAGHASAQLLAAPFTRRDPDTPAQSVHRRPASGST